MPELCLCLDELDFIILDDHAVSIVESANGDAMRLFIGATGVLKAVKSRKKATVMRQHLHIRQAKGGEIGEIGGVGRDGFCTSCGGNPLCRVCDGRGSVAQYNYVFEYTTYVKCGACGGKGGCRTCDATGLMACKPCYGMGEVLVSIKCKTCDGDGRK